MLVRTHADFCAKRNPQFIQAKDLDMQLYRIPCGGIFNSFEYDIPREIIYLIGLYVSEGYFEKIRGKQSNRLVICQNKGDKWNKMLENLYPLIPKERSHRKFYIKLDEKLANFIKINCGHGKLNKFLSPTILNSKHLDALFSAMMLGDGSINKKDGSMVYYTSSRKLKNSFQELCIKLNYDSTVCDRKKFMRESVIRGRKIYSTCRNYEINVRCSENKKILPAKHISFIPYDDDVFCVTVPNHTLYIRRNGKTSWCGNSGTTAIAAKTTRRKYIGIEMDEHSAAIAEARLKAVKTLIEHNFWK